MGGGIYPLRRSLPARLVHYFTLDGGTKAGGMKDVVMNKVVRGHETYFIKEVYNAEQKLL